VAGDETEAFVKAVRFGPRLVGGQLDQAAAGLAREIDRGSEQRVADALAAVALVNPDGLDLGPGCAEAREPGNEGQLQASDDPVVSTRAGLDRDQDLVAVLARDGVEGFGIGWWQGILEALAMGPKWIVREQAYDFGQFGGIRRADFQGMWRVGGAGRGLVQ